MSFFKKKSHLEFFTNYEKQLKAANPLATSDNPKNYKLKITYNFQA